MMHLLVKVIVRRFLKYLRDFFCAPLILNETQLPLEPRRVSFEVALAGFFFGNGNPTG